MSKDFRDLQTTLIKIEAEAGNPNGLATAGNVVLNQAKALCSGFILTSGELRNSLSLAITNDGNNVTTAHVGTNKAYAQYVEFGTGPKGMAHHDGISPDVAVAYTLRPWWIHESQVDPKVPAVYHWPHIDTENGRFYKVSGQPAHPYLYPAFANLKDEIVKIIAGGFEEAAK